MSAAVARARALLGTRFRLHGRGGDGVDCVGLAAAALGEEAVPTGYALRCGARERVAALLDARLVRVEVRAAGDLLLLTTGPGQLHLGVWTGEGLVHADAVAGQEVLQFGTRGFALLGERSHSLRTRPRRRL